MPHFLAFRPTSATRDRLAAVSDRLRAWELQASWTHPDDLHLTVLYLGELAAEEAQLIPTLVEEVASSLLPPRLQLAGLGATGTRGNGLASVPRGVFAAVVDPTHACIDVHRALAACVDQAPERTFVPHLTLCRPHPEPARNQLFRDWPHLLEAHGQADWGPCEVDAVALYVSTDRRQRYNELAVWPLR